MVTIVWLPFIFVRAEIWIYLLDSKQDISCVYIWTFANTRPGIPEDSFRMNLAERYNPQSFAARKIIFCTVLDGYARLCWAIFALEKSEF